jgi:hypothetical protein
LVLLGMQNRTFGPYVAAVDRILILLISRCGPQGLPAVATEAAAAAAGSAAEPFVLKRATRLGDTRLYSASTSTSDDGVDFYSIVWDEDSFAGVGGYDLRRLEQPEEHSSVEAAKERSGRRTQRVELEACIEVRMTRAARAVGRRSAPGVGYPWAVTASRV